MVHLVQPRGRAGGEVGVSCTAARGEVRGRAPCHGPEGLPHPAVSALRHQTVHAEAQVAEERGVAGHRGDGGGRLREAVGAPCPDVVVGLPRRVHREAAIEHRAGRHVADAAVQAVGVAQVR